MHFYIDESGNTGNNLFDEKQPVLHYGVLSSKHDLDVVAAAAVAAARQKVGVERLHASELGEERLAQLGGDLSAIQVDYGLVFDLYAVKKMDYALVSFFDQVFDQGLNPAVSWTSYWTPLRFVLIFKLAALFDEAILKRAWSARVSTDDRFAEAELVAICRELVSRVSILPDARSREVVGDALRWAEQNPAALRYNCKSQLDLKTVSPNLIGFQFVMHGVAPRIASADGATSIVVDQQTQFNESQRALAELYANNREAPWILGIGMPKMDLSNIPTTPLQFRSSKASAGLELVDVYLWLMKRRQRGTIPPAALQPIIDAQMEAARYDEISLDGLAKRWAPWLSSLPELSPEQMKEAAKLLRIDEDRRKAAVQKLLPVGGA